MEGYELRGAFLILVMLAVVFAVLGIDVAVYAVRYRREHGKWPTWQDRTPNGNGNGS